MTQEQLREEFDKKFDVDVYADKINAILDYRGIYDGGKCFNEEVQEHFLEPFYQYLLSAVSKAEVKARQEGRNEGLREASEVALGKKKGVQMCSCGGELERSTGFGKVSFPYQCKKCGSYTDDNTEVNQLCSDISSALLEKIKE